MQLDSTLAAYLAGCIDSDGCLSIKKSTYGRRKGKGHWNPTYNETAHLKQVTPQVPQLLQQIAGGSFRESKPNNQNSKPLFCFEASHRSAVRLCIAILPFLRIKRRQAECILELAESRKPIYLKWSYWFERRFPDWRGMELITTSETAELLSYSRREIVSQAVRNGTLLALPYNHGGEEMPRIPRKLVERLAKLKRQHGTKQGGSPRPVPLIRWRERLWAEVRELNKIGVNGTMVYRREGPFQMKG